MDELNDRIAELEAKVKKLERKENIRSGKKIIKYVIIGIIIISIGVSIYKIYNYAQEKIIQPIDKITEKLELKDNVVEKGKETVAEGKNKVNSLIDKVKNKDND